jgi:polyisoprenoid-binding protein YceI
MRRLIFVATLVTAVTGQTWAAGSESAVVRTIDPGRSTAVFSVTHIFVERVTGTVPVQNGAIVLKAASLVPASATATLDATRIATGDPDRDASLRSPDFFDTKRFPTWAFISTKVTPHGAGAFTMDGNLTIHGVTRPERLDVTVGGDAQHPMYHAIAHVDRRSFGMATTRLDPTIGEVADVTLNILVK